MQAWSLKQWDLYFVPMYEIEAELPWILRNPGFLMLGINLEKIALAT